MAESVEKKRFTREDYFDSAVNDYPWYTKLLQGVVFCVVAALSKLVYPWRIEDGELLWNNHEPRMIIMNHNSFLETVIPTISMWFRGHRVRPVYKSEFEGNAFLHWILPLLGGIPVDRGTADMRAVKRAVNCMKRGESVLVFPEGTRIRSDEQPVEIHGGYALMARMAKVPVQPMAVVGTRDIKPKGRSLPRIFWRVFLKAGPCVGFDEMKSTGRRERTDEMARVGMERVYALREELRAAHPGKH